MNQRSDDNDWPRRVAAHVGAAVRGLRVSRGLSAQQLADRTRMLGHEVKRSVIAEMEVGRRRTIPVADLLVLASALAVPPVALILPSSSAESVEVLPGVREQLWPAYDWVSGRKQLSRVAPWVDINDDADLEHWLTATHGLRLREEAVRLASTRFGHRVTADAYSLRASRTMGAEAARLESLALRETELAERCGVELEKVKEELAQLGLDDPDV